jgi:hypothetical protein
MNFIIEITTAFKDRDICFTLVYRLWAIFAGLCTLVIVVTKMNPEEQGVYYALLNGVAIQLFFELGLNQVVTQVVAGEIGSRKIATGGFVIGRDKYLEKISEVVHLLESWYYFAAIAFSIFGCILGFFYIKATGINDKNRVIWFWILLIFGTGLNLRFIPRFSVTEAMNGVAGIAKLRLVQSMASNCLSWLCFIWGFGLWGIIVIPFANLIVAKIWISRSDRFYDKIILQHPKVSAMQTWKSVILPLQWRMALSWMSGYIVFNLLPLIVFNKYGAVEAGRLGLSLSLYSALLNLGSSWVSAKFPRLVEHVAKGEYLELNTTFSKAWRNSVSFTVVTSIIVVLFAPLLSMLNPQLSSRLSDQTILIALCVVTIANSVIFGAALYMRSFREEPMTMISVISAVSIVVVAWVGSHFNQVALVFCYVCVVILVTLPWTLIKYFGYLKRAQVKYL